MPDPTGASSAHAQPSEVRCALREHDACLTLNGPVTVPAIQRLVGQMKLAFDYYQYESVEIEIDSPGGELRALNYFLEHRNAWRRRGYAVHTRGVVTCASAAALLLAFGDPGGRRIYRSTELLFHFSRVRTGSGAMTAAEAGRLGTVLQRTDDAMLDALVAHITGQDSGAGFGALAAFQAQATGRLAWITATEVSVPGATDGYDRPDPHQADLLREVIGEADGLDGLSLRLRTHLQRRFGEEELMDHAEAYVLNLVDHISGITPEENVEW